MPCLFFPQHAHTSDFISKMTRFSCTKKPVSSDLIHSKSNFLVSHIAQE